jgi:hypothetical protein
MSLPSGLNEKSSFTNLDKKSDLEYVLNRFLHFICVLNSIRT